ncbi:MAG: hypothetical protein Fur006_18150 [Coleofasciculaceae cyanobacterium]
MIFVKDDLGRFQFINRKFENLFHITNEQIQGKTDRDVFPKELADAFCQNDIEVLTCGVPSGVQDRRRSDRHKQSGLLPHCR